MFQRSFLVFVFSALVGLLATADLATAQKGGGGRGGGGRGGGGGAKVGGGARGGGAPIQRGGVYPGAGAYRGAYYGRGFGYGGIYFGSPYYDGFYGGLGGYGSGFGIGSYYSSPFLYSTPPYYYGTPRYSFYPEPAPPSIVQPVVPVSNAASIRVLVPDGQAKVFFDGNPTKQGGTERLFHTPELDPKGGPYSYRIRATWKSGAEDMIQERVVVVTPGKTSIADFR